jgi:hypothetical protein
MTLPRRCDSGVPSNFGERSLSQKSTMSAPG